MMWKKTLLILPIVLLLFVSGVSASDIEEQFTVDSGTCTLVLSS